jgi:hypothetical protein
VKISSLKAASQCDSSELVIFTEFGITSQANSVIQPTTNITSTTNSTREEEVFINEVATIRLIHNANIVCLLRFCSEGTRRVCIYEFMPNESLEKYIFSHDSNIFQGLLVFTIGSQLVKALCLYII